MEPQGSQEQFENHYITVNRVLKKILKVADHVTQ